MVTFGAFLRAAAVAVAIAAAGTAAQGAVSHGERMFGYCSATAFGSGDGRVWVSSVFTVDSDVYHVGVANSFRSHLEGVRGVRVNTPQCAGYHDSRQAALDSRNEALRRYRSFGRSVDVVQWSYHGD
jgi:hypothetical protein